MRLSEKLRGKNSFLTGNFLLLILTWVLMYSAQPIPDTYSSIYYLSLGATPFLLSVMFFIGSLAIAFVQVPGGYLADSSGRRWLIFTMTFGLAFSYLFFVFAPSWQYIVVGMILQNLCLIYQPALMAMMIDSLPPEKRATGFNFQSVIASLVSLPAPLIMAAFVVLFHFNLGMRIGYSIVVVAYLIAAALRVKLKETLISEASQSRPKILHAFRNYFKCARESWQVWSKVPRSAFYIFVSSTAMNGLVTGCQIYFVLYATKVLNVSLSQWAIVLAFMYLSTALPAIVAGLRMDVTGRKSFLVLGYLLHVPAMLLLITANFSMLLLAFFLFGLGHMLQTNSSQVILGDLVPRELRGKAVGCIQFFMYLTQGFLYLLIGFLYVYVSPQLPFVLLAVSSLPLALLVVYKVNEPKVKEV
jgi:DHA1 family tetracycline resistance protein-like MFS transporter